MPTPKKIRPITPGQKNAVVRKNFSRAGVNLSHPPTPDYTRFGRHQELIRFLGSHFIPKIKKNKPIQVHEVGVGLTAQRINKNDVSFEPHELSALFNKHHVNARIIAFDIHDKPLKAVQSSTRVQSVGTPFYHEDQNYAKFLGLRKGKRSYGFPKKVRERVHVVRAMATHLPVNPKKKADLSIMLNVLNHFPPEMRRIAFRELVQNTKVGGVIAITRLRRPPLRDLKKMGLTKVKEAEDSIILERGGFYPPSIKSDYQILRKNKNVKLVE